MPTLNKVRLRTIKRKDKPDFIMGENAEGTFFINSYDPPVLELLFKAANEGQVVDISGNYKAPQAGSMTVNSISVSPSSVPTGISAPIPKSGG